MLTTRLWVCTHEVRTDSTDAIKSVSSTLVLLAIVVKSNLRMYIKPNKLQRMLGSWVVQHGARACHGFTV